MYVLGYIFGIVLALVVIPLTILWLFSLGGKAARGVPTAGNIARANVREQDKARAIREATDATETYGSEYD